MRNHPGIVSGILFLFFCFAGNQGLLAQSQLSDQEIIKRLKSPRISDRLQALQEIADSNRTHLAHKVSGRLRDRNPKVRFQAFTSLAILGVPRYASTYARALGSRNLTKRSLAALALKKIDAIEYLPEIARSALNPTKVHHDELERFSLEALNHFGGHQIITTLLEEARKAGKLKRTGSPRSLLFQKYVENPRLDSRWPLMTESKIVNGLGSQIDHDRFNAIRAISSQGRIDFSPELLQLLRTDPDTMVRVVALEALADFGSPKHIRTFARFLNSQNPDMKIAAAQGLANAEAVESLPEIAKVALAPLDPDREASESIRTWSLSAFRHLEGHKIALTLIEEAKNSGELKTLTNSIFTPRRSRTRSSASRSNSVGVARRIRRASSGP